MHTESIILPIVIINNVNYAVNVKKYKGRKYKVILTPKATAVNWLKLWKAKNPYYSRIAHYSCSDIRALDKLRLLRRGVWHIANLPVLWTVVEI